MEYSTSVEASIKVTVAKNNNYNKSFGCQGEKWITVKLQDPFCNWAVVKMREAMFAFAKTQSHLCYSCTRIFFSCFNTSLSLNENIFIRLCCQVLLHTCKPGKSDAFSHSENKGIERKWQLRKEMNFWPISSEIQQLEMTFKPISITERNVVRQTEFCVLNLADPASLMY